MIGYYVHHHGNGHRARAKAVLAAWGGPSMILTSMAAEGFDSPVLELPLDHGADTGETPEELHWAPIGSEGLSGRMRLIANWIDTARPELMVVDVSVEVALLSRLCGVPFVYVRQAGHRTDPAHSIAYRWARGLIAPFPRFASGERSLPPGLESKEFFAGGVTRFDGRRRPEPPRGERVVLVTGPERERIAGEIREWCPDWRVRVSTGDLTLGQLTEATVVVGAAGNNLVSEVAFAKRGMVCLPEERPFDEQINRGQALESDRAAVVLDAVPEADRWEGLLRDALGRAHRLERWADGMGARRMAAELDYFLDDFRWDPGFPGPDPNESPRLARVPQASPVPATRSSAHGSGARWR